VAVSKTSVSKALARAGNRVSSRQNEDDETEYRIMTKGRSEVEHVLGGELMSVVRIEGGHPRTARISLGEMLSDLTGVVRICDPYYGLRTLDSLDHVPDTCSIRFLTARTSEPIGKVHSAVKDFVREHPRAQFRLAQKPAELHDRYVVTADRILILGHGLKDIGGKESFLIRLGREILPDLIVELSNAFDARWSVGTAIP